MSDYFIEQGAHPIFGFGAGTFATLLASIRGAETRDSVALANSLIDPFAPHSDGYVEVHERSVGTRVSVFGDDLASPTVILVRVDTSTARKAGSTSIAYDITDIVAVEPLVDGATDAASGFAALAARWGRRPAPFSGQVSRHNPAIFVSPGSSLTGISDRTGDVGVSVQGGVEGTVVTTRTLKAGSGVAITAESDGVLISSTAVGTITGIQDLGTDTAGISLQAGVDGSNVQTRTLRAGAGIAITAEADGVQVASTNLPPDAPPQIAAVQPPYPQSLGPQNLSVERRLTRDLTYTPTPDWEAAAVTAMGGTKRPGIKLLSAFTNATDQNRLVAAYRTGQSGRLVFIEFTTLAGEGVIYRSTTADSFTDVLTLFANGLTRVLRFYYVWNDATDAGEQPLSPEDLQLNVRFWDLDLGEQLTISTDYLQSYVPSANVTTSGSSGDIVFAGTTTNTNLYGVNCFLALVQNEIRHGWAGTGLIYEFGGADAWNGVNYPVRWRVENLNCAPAELQYTVSDLTNVTFRRLDGSTSPPSTTTFTQAQVDSGEIIAEISGPPSTSHTFTVTVDDLRYGTQLVETFRFTSNSSVERVSGIVQAELSNFARRDGTDVGLVALGGVDATSAVQIRTGAGAAVFDAGDSGGVTLSAAANGAAIRLVAHTTGQVILEPTADTGSYVSISEVNKSAAEYASDIALLDDAVPNKAYVDSTASAAVSDKAAKDGTDAGAVILGSLDSETSIIARSAAPGGRILTCDATTGATSLASQNADLSLLTQGTGSAGLTIQLGATGGVIATSIPSASDYAARCIGIAEAIVNEQRLQDAIAAAAPDLTPYVLADGTNTGGVTVGSTDDSMTVSAQDDVIIRSAGGGAVESRTNGSVTVSPLVGSAVFGVSTSIPDITAGASYVAPGFTSLLTKGTDFSGLTTATMLTALTDTATGVANKHYGGRRMRFIAGQNIVSGRILTLQAGTSDPPRVVYVNGGVAADIAESQVVGVALADATTGNPVDVAIDGVCSILAGAAGTAARGIALVCQAASTGKIQAPGVNINSDEAVIGVCLSTGAIANNAPVLVMVRPAFEHF